MHAVSQSQKRAINYTCIDTMHPCVSANSQSTTLLLHEWNIGGRIGGGGGGGGGV